MSYQSQVPNQPGYGAAAGAPGPGEPFDGAANPDDLRRPLYGASFGQAIKRFFKNYANFKGRASRSEFWWIALFSFLIQLIPFILYVIGLGSMTASLAAGTTVDSEGNIVAMDASGTGGGTALFTIGLILMIVIGLAMLIPGIAIHWRRLHDANFAGPFWFLTFVPSIGSIIVLIFTLLPSKPEGRRFDVGR